MYLRKRDEATGALSVDDAFRDADGQPSFSVAKRAWPHGWTGEGAPTEPFSHGDGASQLRCDGRLIAQATEVRQTSASRPKQISLSTQSGHKPNVCFRPISDIIPIHKNVAPVTEGHATKLSYADSCASV